jgi:hypothetical protein
MTDAQKEYLSVKVTKIGKRWHARLLINGRVQDESACSLQCDIGWICRNMLRMHDKCGGTSRLACAARTRKSLIDAGNPVGRVWYSPQLYAEREARLVIARAKEVKV